MSQKFDIIKINNLFTRQSYLMTIFNFFLKVEHYYLFTQLQILN